MAKVKITFSNLNIITFPYHKNEIHFREVHDCLWKGYICKSYLHFCKHDFHFLESDFHFWYSRTIPIWQIWLLCLEKYFLFYKEWISIIKRVPEMRIRFTALVLCYIFWVNYRTICTLPTWTLLLKIFIKPYLQSIVVLLVKRSKSLL